MGEVFKVAADRIQWRQNWMNRVAWSFKFDPDVFQKFSSCITWSGNALHIIIHPALTCTFSKSFSTEGLAFRWLSTTRWSNAFCGYQNVHRFRISQDLPDRKPGKLAKNFISFCVPTDFMQRTNFSWRLRELFIFLPRCFFSYFQNRQIRWWLQALNVTCAYYLYFRLFIDGYWRWKRTTGELSITTGGTLSTLLKQFSLS